MDNNYKYHENQWSPFDPKWYHDAFDQYICTADELFNTDMILKEGYDLPDADGSRSSIFRNNAKLNNSFNEQDLRNTLLDIYTNNSNMLIASNHNEVVFFQWDGKMSDLTYLPNTNICELRIPTESFIDQKQRNQYKLSQYYRKWIKSTDLLEHWNIFKWYLMLFVNQRIYLDYELHMDDQETIIRFKFYDHWKYNDYPVYIYKFYTNASTRIFISRELCNNQWGWKLPIDYITDQQIINSSHVIGMITKIDDPNIRNDGLTNIDTMGDNIEFLSITDGYIDLTNLSNFNKNYINSEATEYLSLSLVVPKYFEEYSIMLPSESVYRAYQPKLRKVYTNDEMGVRHINVLDDKKYKNVYIDINGSLNNVHNGWIQMIRPIVLSDAYDHPFDYSYKEFLNELRSIRDLTVIAANTIEEFRMYMVSFNVFNDQVIKYATTLTAQINDIYNTFNNFLIKRHIDKDIQYETNYAASMDALTDIIENGINSKWFDRSLIVNDTNTDIWFVLSPQIHIPREMYDRYNYMIIMDAIPNNGIVWNDIDDRMNKQRFRRPIEPSDFWTFEYDFTDGVWRPKPLSIMHKYPDVYLLSDKQHSDPEINVVYKAFLFYSDTMNVVDTIGDIRHATPAWDEDISEYELNKCAIYHDIYMEKFYWMGVNCIYQGRRFTNARWELIENVIDNQSFDRFNELYLNTIDPYFKMGMATYLRDKHNGFPLDFSIAKIQESMTTNFLNYNRITNFEQYLDKSFRPSYFDYIEHIDDNWRPGDRWIKRPRLSFDINKLLPLLLNLQQDTIRAVTTVNSTLEWIINQLSKESYGLNIDNILAVQSKILDMLNNIKLTYQFTSSLDLDIYSVNDINHIIDLLNTHLNDINIINDKFNNIHDDIINHNVYQYKKDILKQIYDKYVNNIYDVIIEISGYIQSFDMEKFMLNSNNLYTYLEHDKNNPNDESLIGYINQFTNDWTISVKKSRNKLFQSTSKLYALYIKNKAYTTDEVIEFTNAVKTVELDLSAFEKKVSEFWLIMNHPTDTEIIDLINDVKNILNNFHSSFDKYFDTRDQLVTYINEMYELFDKMYQYNISETEINIYNDIKSILDQVLLSVSYIAGSNDLTSTIEYFEQFKDKLLEWNSFVLIEEEIFTKLIEFTEDPMEFITSLKENEAIIKSMIDYMNTANFEFIPDDELPTYASVFKTTSVKISNIGFKNNKDDTLIVPKIGCYNIDSVNDTGGITDISNLNYYNLTFRNPMVQNIPYDTFTNGIGMGVIIEPASVLEYKIINDTIVKSYIGRINNLNYMISSNLSSINPYSSGLYNNIIHIYEKMINDWNNMLSKYTDHLTDESKNYFNALLDRLSIILDNLLTYNDTRNNNNLDKLISEIDGWLLNTNDAYGNIHYTDKDYYYYETQVNTALTELKTFYGTGTRWNESTILKQLMNKLKYPLKLFKDRIIDPMDESNIKTELLNQYDLICIMINNVIITTDTLINMQIKFYPDIRLLQSLIDNMDENIIHKDVYYRIKSSLVSESGTGYKMGDIVKISIDDNLILLFTVKEVVNDIVTRIEPIMDYALTSKVWSVYRTTTIIGTGHGMTIDIKSYEITNNDITLFRDDIHTLYHPMYNENDLFAFSFQNIYDLNVSYEVFLGGKQIPSYINRHFDTNESTLNHPIDTIYLNANSVMELLNSSLYKPASSYFVYQIDGFDIVDPGSGYCIGQTVYVANDYITLKLKVKSLVEGISKGINELELVNIKINSELPSINITNAEIVNDSMNNIDDEFNNGYYDLLTSDGIIKPATKTYNPDVYTFWSHRFDNLKIGDRNTSYMYPDINPSTNYPTEGDPDYHFYLGSRINNSITGDTSDRFNGIMNTIDINYGITKETDRTPTGQPVKGEYQLIIREHIHNSNDYHYPGFNGWRKDDIEGLRTALGLDNWHIPFPVTDEEIEEIVNTAFAMTESTYKSHSSIVMSTIALINYDTEYYKFRANPIVNKLQINGDYIVQKYSQIPKHINDWPTATIGKCVIVEHDETHGGHRMLYRLRTFVVTGFFVYDLPEIADYSWDKFEIHWMGDDSYPDFPAINAIYPTAPWNTNETYTDTIREITDKYYQPLFPNIKENKFTYIYNITVDDLSVWNHTLHRWEDLHTDKWTLVPDNTGFTLYYNEDGLYSYDMSLYLNKTPFTQKKNEALKRNAIINVNLRMNDVVNTPPINTSIQTGRDLRIRKLFPYEQTNEFTIGKLDDGIYNYTMDFIINPYIHYRNELHLEDIKVFNVTANRFENILDPNMFEVRFKDDKCNNTGYETNTTIKRCIITNAGSGFVPGEVWAYNSEYDIHIFGTVNAEYKDVGFITSFTPNHVVNIPKESITLEFDVYQGNKHRKKQKAMILAEFNTERVKLHDDGYIHNVTNRLAPLPKEIRIIYQGDLKDVYKYKIRISKSSKSYTFVRPDWELTPVFHIPEYNIQQDSIYMMTPSGRFPLVNPNTGKPSFIVTETEQGTDICLQSLYRANERIEFRTTPYPMRSVYTQRLIPSHGYINLAGKLNKPLNKKYFEFWVNGKLLTDEVTIITPTKIIMHGLKSLKNLEIIEINRDPNEYFSDVFLYSIEDEKRPLYGWDYDTYLDAALEGRLDGDNYTIAEQEALLEPVWTQISEDHPEFKRYSPNVDSEIDILIKADNGETPIESIDKPYYDYMVIDPPTIESHQLYGQTNSFDDFRFIPISDDMIIDILNEEWKDEIENDPYFPEHSVMTDDQWYGTTAVMYDKYGIQVHALNDAAYIVADDDFLKINTSTSLSRIIKSNTHYDLT